MKSLRIIMSLFIFLVFSTTGCHRSDEDILSVTCATDATWPPMEMVDENKNIVGFDIDFLNAVAKEAGFRVEFKNTAWDGIFAGIAAGKYDLIMSSVTILEERKKTMSFSEPYINIGLVLVVPNGSDATSIANLTGEKVGAQIGTTSAREIEKFEGVELKSYDEIGMAFEDMANGRIAGVVCDTVVASHYALRREEYKKRFKMAGDILTEENYGIVVGKDNKLLLDLINKGIRAVKEKGVDKELEDKWLR